MSSRFPDFFIIGAMKSATSSVHEQLAALPGITMSTPKEPNFFSNDEVYMLGQEWYLSLFAEAAENDLIGESSTHYTKLPTYPNTVKRMSSCVTSPKLIYIMRNPVDRLISQYIHEWSQRNISISIDLAINDTPELTDYSRYHFQLKPYLDLYGSENILPVFFERLKRYPDEELQRICQFIGYRGEVRWQHEIEPSNRSDQRIRKFPFYDMVIENKLLRYLRRKLVPKTWRNAIKSNLVISTRPVLSAQSEASVKKVIDEDLKKLGSLFQIQLSCDNYNEQILANPINWHGKEAFETKAEEAVD